MNEPIEPGQDATLSEICRSAAYLMAAASKPLRRISVRSGDAAIELEWPEEAGAVPTFAAPMADFAERGPEIGQEGSDLVYIKADTVGTFFRAPEPGADPFVDTGDMVDVGQQVAILEVMKMMSPIVADRPGRIVEILASDGESVEFDTRLLAIAPTVAAL